MKLLILILSIGTVSCCAQSFEGKIIYEVSYKSKSPKLNDEQLNMTMGTNQEYYIRGGNYKTIVNGVFIKMHLYRGTENRSYTLTSINDSLFWEDYAINKDVATGFEMLTNKDTVLGVPCNVIIVYTAKSKTSYYFNKNYGVNPDLFKNHMRYNWYYIISKTNALPLKTVYEDDVFASTSTAINITPMKLNDEFFDLVDKTKVIPAFW